MSPLKLLGTAAAIASLAVRPVIPLRPDSASTDQPLDTVREGIRRRLGENPGLLVADGDALVSRFGGQAGGLPYNTVELVRVEPTEITFEHLHGPFHACFERFALEALPDGGGTRVTHDGWFRMRFGLPGWLVGVAMVRPRFERLVVEHLRAQLAGTPTG